MCVCIYIYIEREKVFKATCRNTWAKLVTEDTLANGVLVFEKTAVFFLIKSELSSNILFWSTQIC